MKQQAIAKNELPAILIVDDCLINLGEAVKNLESRGYCVSTEQNGEEGLRCAGSVQPDIILLDVMMPGIDGFEFCRRLKKQIVTRDIPVIFMTEPAETMSKVACFQAGAVDYLTKPLQTDEVVACVQTQLNLRHMQKRLETQNALLQRYREQLEQRVAERTHELTDNNQRLRKEIQERRSLDERLRLKEFVLDHAGDTVYLIDRTPRFIYVNEAACRALGYSRDELLDMGPFDIDPNVTPQDTLRFREQMQATGSFSYETHHRRRDGSLFPVEIRGVLIEFQGQWMTLTLAHDITERKQAETLLMQREREFRSLANNLPDNIARWDREGRYLYLNPTHEQTLQMPAAEVLSKRASELFPDGRFDYPQRVITQVGETGRAQTISVPVQQDDGSLSIHQVSYVAERNAQGEIVGVLGIGRDMTEQIRLHESLTQSEAALRSLTDSAPFSIIRYDVEGRITYANASLLNFLGVPLDELIGRLPCEIWTDGLYSQIEQGIAQVRKTKAQVVVEFSQLDIEGKTVQHQVWVVPEKKPSNEIVGIIAFGFDVTERKRAEREVNLLNRALDNSFDATYLLDADLRFRFVNEAAVRELGYSREEFLAMNLLDIDPNASREAVQGMMRQTAANGRFPGTIESQHRRKNGEIIPVEIGATVFNYEDEILYLTVVRNVSQRKEIEQYLEKSRTQLRGLIAHRESAREEERKLIAREVHDELGQILSGLKLNIALVADKCAAKSETLREHFSESMILIDQAIGVARNVASTLRPVALDMGIVSSLEWLVNRFATYSGIECKIHIAEQDIRFQENCAIALFRIVQESLTNVARHAQADKLSISLYSDGDNYILTVHDNGKGFDMSEKKPNSFGLVGIRERALMLGGSLRVNSLPGEGTKIEVRIPCARNKSAFT